MTGPIFDTHAHYSARAFDADRFALLDSLPAKGVVGVCEQATHSGDAPRVLELAHRYPWVVAAIGIHPESLLPAADGGEDGPAPTVSVYGGDWAAEMRALAPCYEDPKVVAVGECGLDYHWPVPKDAQLALFEAEIRLALELDKPIIVHDRQAHADVYALLKKYRPKGIVHCYSGSADDAVWLAQQGLYIVPAPKKPAIRPYSPHARSPAPFPPIQTVLPPPLRKSAAMSSPLSRWQAALPRDCFFHIKLFPCLRPSAPHFYFSAAMHPFPPQKQTC